MRVKQEPLPRLTKEDRQRIRDCRVTYGRERELLDEIDTLEAEKALERANERDLILQEISSGKSIIPEIAHALDKLLAKARAEEAEVWYQKSNDTVVPGMWIDWAVKRLAALHAEAERKAK
jgi:hypothetical protein